MLDGKMLDLNLEDCNGNNVRVVIHDSKLENIVEDITVYQKWNDGTWVPIKNMNTWNQAAEIVKQVISIIDYIY